MIVTVSNEANLKRAKDLLKAGTDSETVELALEIVLRDFEEGTKKDDLPDGFFEELFSEKTALSDRESIQTIVREREEAKF